MKNRVGIKTEGIDCTLAINELIIGDLEGLIAYLGDGFFVVTEEGAEGLTKKGIEFVGVEIVIGRPQSSAPKVRRDE